MSTDKNEEIRKIRETIQNAKINKFRAQQIHENQARRMKNLIKDSEIGNKIKKELIEKAKEGIKIRIIYDDVGCWRFWFHRSFFKEMKTYGIEIIPYLKGKIAIPVGGQLNYRNHRKIVVIDGKIGYMLQKDNLLEWRTIYKNVLLPDCYCTTATIL